MTGAFSGVPEQGAPASSAPGSGVRSVSESGCRRIFLEGNLTVNELCAGDEVRNLRTLSSLFGVEISARENIISFRGDEEQQGRINGFFADLSALCKLRKSPITQRDFDFLCGSYRNNTSSDPAKLWKNRLEVSPKKPCVMPRSRRQQNYVEMMRSCEVVFGIGPAGTGKTYLAMAMAVASFLKGEVSRIVLTRPARESGEKLGYLPGSMEEKVSPYLRPLYDALYDMLPYDEAQALILKGVIEVAPLAFMRGRTLNNSFIILDEAQNTTVDQMLMFLTRMGFGSRCVVTGDPQQSDLRENERSGLKHALETLQNIRGIGFALFEPCDVVRHRLIETIITHYTSGEGFTGRS